MWRNPVPGDDRPVEHVDRATLLRAELHAALGRIRATVPRAANLPQDADAAAQKLWKWGYLPWADRVVIAQLLVLHETPAAQLRPDEVVARGALLGKAEAVVERFEEEVVAAARGDARSAAPAPPHVGLPVPMRVTLGRVVRRAPAGVMGVAVWTLLPKGDTDGEWIVPAVLTIGVLYPFVHVVIDAAIEVVATLAGWRGRRQRMVIGDPAAVRQALRADLVEQAAWIRVHIPGAAGLPEEQEALLAALRRQGVLTRLQHRVVRRTLGGGAVQPHVVAEARDLVGALPWLALRQAARPAVRAAGFVAEDLATPPHGADVQALPRRGHAAHVVLCVPELEGPGALEEAARRARSPRELDRAVDAIGIEEGVKPLVVVPATGGGAGAPPAEVDGVPVVGVDALTPALERFRAPLPNGPRRLRRAAVALALGVALLVLVFAEPERWAAMPGYACLFVAWELGSSGTSALLTRRRRAALDAGPRR